MPRFSENLDFILKVPDRAFKWERYVRQLVAGMEEFGLHTEVRDKSNMDHAVRQAILKDDASAIS